MGQSAALCGHRRTTHLAQHTIEGLIGGEMLVFASSYYDSRIQAIGSPPGAPAMKPNFDDVAPIKPATWHQMTFSGRPHCRVAASTCSPASNSLSGRSAQKRQTSGRRRRGVCRHAGLGTRDALLAFSVLHPFRTLEGDRRRKATEISAGK